MKYFLDLLIIIHEMGHLIVAFICDIPCEGIYVNGYKVKFVLRLNPFKITIRKASGLYGYGYAITHSRINSDPRNLITSAAGPAAEIGIPLLLTLTVSWWFLPLAVLAIWRNLKYNNSEKDSLGQEWFGDNAYTSFCLDEIWRERNPDHVFSSRYYKFINLSGSNDDSWLIELKNEGFFTNPPVTISKVLG